MRVPERISWRLYLSLSQNAARARPLSSLHHQLDCTDWSRPKNVFSSPLRDFLASNKRSSFFVCNIPRFAYSTQGGHGKAKITDEDKHRECSSSSFGGSGWSKEEVVNWPNAISMGRLLSGPLLAWYVNNCFFLLSRRSA